jgi:hypothetical protein
MDKIHVKWQRRDSGRTDMRINAAVLFGAVISVLGCFCATAQDAGFVQVKQTFSITLTPDPAIVKIGARIWVNVSIKNLQDQPLDVLGGFFPYGLSGLDGRYEWKCTDEAGRAVTKEILQVGSAHDYLYLEPGKTRELTVEVNGVCALQRPGKYRATLIRKSTMHPNDPIVSSNTITIEVQ